MFLAIVGRWSDDIYGPFEKAETARKFLQENFDEELADGDARVTEMRDPKFPL